jgi:tryptophan synthase
MVREARKRGLEAPVLLMGYCNPMMSYGEENLIRDAKEAGVNGFIMVDLPPEECVRFRNHCTKGGYAFYPQVPFQFSVLIWLDYPLCPSLPPPPPKLE